MRFPAILASIAGMLATPAYAECNPRFVSESQTVTVTDVSVGTGEVSTEQFNIRVANEGNGQCSAIIKVNWLGTIGHEGQLELGLRSGSSLIQILSNESEAPLSDGNLPVPGIPGGANGRAVPMTLFVGTDWGVASGDHTAQLLLTLLGPKGEPVDTMVLTIIIRVPPSVSLRIVGATGEASIAQVALGNVTSRNVSVSDPFGARVWSTSPYLVTFSSANRGSLVHTSGLDKIEYELRMDNQVVDLVGANEFVFLNPTDALGDIHPLRVQAGPAAARAGDYSDRVTVTVSAL